MISKTTLIATYFAAVQGIKLEVSSPTMGLAQTSGLELGLA